MIEVIHPGLLTTIQDVGRKGYEQYGMPRSGYFDPFLAAVANRLVGNEPASPLLEFALIGPTLKPQQECVFAVAAYDAVYRVDGQPVPTLSAFEISAGSLLQFVTMRGWFGYLAVAGGFHAGSVLGSVSTYTAGNLGVKLTKGMLLRALKGDSSVERFALSSADYIEPSPEILLLPGLHTSLFAEKDKHTLMDNSYTIHAQSNRMGIHMTGAALSSIALLHSVPALPGTVQIPPEGQPIILGPEGPTTGGYPQVAVMARAAWSTLAAAGPGKPLGFRWTSIEQASEISRTRNAIFAMTEPWRKL